MAIISDKVTEAFRTLLATLREAALALEEDDREFDRIQGFRGTLRPLAARWEIGEQASVRHGPRKPKVSDDATAAVEG